ncbi:MAG: Ger(x)C family spore germination protein [Clostridia bacterium]|nr:Ger(x)C family spore germination protein [Clostridia bacterium]
MKRYKVFCLLLILLCWMLAGCSPDLVEIDEEVYALVLGADISANNKIKITLQYPSYKGSGGGGSGSKSSGGGGGGSREEIGVYEGNIITTVEASSILEGINLLNTAVSRQISLTHCKLLVFSEELAKQGVEDYLAPMMRYRDMRRIMHVIVCKGKAESFIKENINTIGESESKAIELMATQSLNNGLFPRMTFIDFYRNMLSPYEQPLTAYAGINDFSKLSSGDEETASPLKIPEGYLPSEVPRKGAARRELAGTAIFNGPKMIGVLDSFETRCMLIIKNQFKRGIVTIEDRKAPGKVIPLDVRLGRKPVIKGYFENGVPIIDVRVNIEADLGAIQSRVNYERLSLVEALNGQIKEFFEAGLRQTIDKTQRLNCDVFGFGEYIAGNFSTIQELEAYNWKKHYKDAKVNVTVEANVRRTGLMFGSKPLKSSQ